MDTMKSNSRVPAQNIDTFQDEPLKYPISEDRKNFEAEISTLLNSQSYSGRSLFIFFRRSLMQFHLNSAYSEAYIFNESYIRGIKLIETGKAIRNPTAWIRQTGYHIIQELNRIKHKSVPFEENLGEVEQTLLSDEVLADDLATIRIAFQMLLQQEQKLLNLKIVDGLAWKEIRELLALEGYEDYNETALRKRKERALNHLRQIYYSLKPPLETSKRRVQ